MKAIQLPPDPRSVVEEHQYLTEEALVATLRHSLTVDSEVALEWAAAGVELAGHLAAVLQARARHNNGWAMMRCGRHTAAEREYRTALDILGDRYPAEKAVVLRRMAVLRLAQDSPAEALPLVDEAVELSSKHGSDHDLGCAILEKGVVFRAFGRIDDAATSFAESLHYLPYDRSPEEFEAAVHNLAWAIVESPNPRSSSQVFGAVKVARAVLPPDCVPARVRLRWLEGVAYLRLGHNRRSVTLLTPVPRKLATMATKQEQAAAYVDLAEAHDRAASHDRAQRAMARALALYQSIEGINPDAVAAVAGCLESMRSRLGAHPWSVRETVTSGRLSERARPFTRPAPVSADEDLYWSDGRSPW